MLADIPAALMLVGLAAYTVLAGADFGAGFWTLVPGGGRASSAATRDHARHAMGPVWEANHVWLIFVLVVCWTAYPVAFASITSTLSVPFFIAAVGGILRGASYALRGQLDASSGRRLVECVFALSSIMTPFALGTVVGAIAAGRVPVGNARGEAFGSWLNPTSVLIGTLAVATSSYLAAVYLAADARRLGEHALERDFRVRALVMGFVAGALAIAALAVVRADAPLLWSGLTSGAGLVMVCTSAAAGLLTLLLVLRRRFEPARASAVGAVGAIVAGWAFAQYPRFLPGLTVEQAAAGPSTLSAVVIGVGAGAMVLIPALTLLFGLFLRGHLDAHGSVEALAADLPRGPAKGRAPRLGWLALTCLLAGCALLVVSDSGWAHAVSVVSLFASVPSAFVLAVDIPSDMPGSPISREGEHRHE